MRLRVPSNLDGVERELQGWQRRARQAATSGAFRLFPQLAVAALQVAAAGFAPAPIPHFFSTDVREISPTLNDDLLELYGRADQVVQHRFAFFGELQDFGGGIDWQPPHSPAWCAELHACDYVFDLACTFRISSEPCYSRQLRYLIADWIASNPPAFGSGWHPEVVARRVRNWMLAADFARRDWERDREFAGVVAESLGLQVAFLLGQLYALTSVEAKLHASRALLCAARFFRGSQSREAWQAGLDLLSMPSTDTYYDPCARLAQAQALTEWSLWSPQDSGSGVPARELRDALHGLEAVLMPTGSLPLIGPRARLAPDELADLAALAAVATGSPAWKSIAGKFGIVPYLLLGESGRAKFEAISDAEWAPRDAVSGEAELLRVAGEHGSALAVAAHLPVAANEHQDFSSYELTLHNYRVITDSGGFGAESAGQFASPQAHNLLTIDGRDPQWVSSDGRARPEFHYLPCGVARLRVSDPGCDFCGIQHTRAWFRLPGDVWVILDWLLGEGSHRLTSRLHFYPTLDLMHEGDRVVARGGAGCFTVVSIANATPSIAITRGADAESPGWFSPEFGVKFPAAVLALEWAGAPLPWLGGVLTMSGAPNGFRQLEVNADEGRVRLELRDRMYDLPM